MWPIAPLVPPRIFVARSRRAIGHGWRKIGAMLSLRIGCGKPQPMWNRKTPDWAPNECGRLSFS